MRYPSLSERLSAKTRYSLACWQWTGARRTAGYGVIWHRGRSISTHRAAWELAYGAIPLGLCVLHWCDDPTCVNPAHLFLGTKGENCADRSAKGRDSHGEDHYLAKLSDDKVREIRTSDRSNTDLARKYGVSREAVRAARERRTWRHV